MIICQREDRSPGFPEYNKMHAQVVKLLLVDTHVITFRSFKSALSYQKTLEDHLLNICSGGGSRQYCRYTKSPLGITPLKEIWESPWVKENLTLVGFEPTTSLLDLPMLYRLSYEASTAAARQQVGVI